MKTLQHGFTLIIVMTVLMVLSLIVMATFEQTQWVKRSQSYVWLQVKMQERLWQQLVVAEMQLPQRALSGKCFVPYSVSNDYFFMTHNPWPTGACMNKMTDESITVVYERLMTQPCAQIKGNAQTGVHFFRISVQSQSTTSGQKMILQTVEAMPVVNDKSTEKRYEDTICAAYPLYAAGRQSWLLQ